MNRIASLGGPIAASLRFMTFIAAAWLAIAATGVRADAAPTDAPDDSVIPTRGALLEKTRLKIKSVYDYLDAGEPDKALIRIEQIGMLIPDAERLYLQGRAQLALGDHTTACTKLRSAIQKRGRCGEFHFWLGQAYRASGSHAMAISAFEKAALKGLETSTLHEAWAASLLETEDVLGEIRRTAFEMPAESWHVPGGLSRDGVLVHCVDPDRNEWVMAPRTSAIYHAQRATELDEESGTAWLVAGDVWARAGFHDVAALRYHRAADLLKEDALARCHQRWAECLFAVADYEGFVEHAKLSAKASASAGGVNLAEVYDRAAVGHALVGATDKQVTCLKFACELAPTVERKLKLADALFAMQRTDEASASLRDALSMNPTRAEKRLIRRRFVHVARAALPGQR